ncbi:hypothetical protein [Maribacter litopenaei]|uniref:hypothetical protein n=1 Tax=Maribacter litopenaei TaxID=2976127 RepID=UPI003083EEE5
MLDSTDKGGLGYSTELIGTIFGTAGVIMLSFGGILGGILISRDGLKKWMLPMVLSLNLPNILYAIRLSQKRPMLSRLRLRSCSRSLATDLVLQLF